MKEILISKTESPQFKLLMAAMDEFKTVKEAVEWVAMVTYSSPGSLRVLRCARDPRLLSQAKIALLKSAFKEKFGRTLVSKN